MAPEKVTIMILHVDLKCPCCYKKVRKLLYKFPQIRDQVFDVDKNKVMIKVVCCDPERIRDKLCCKGGKAIQSIEIVENKPKPPEKPKPDTKPPPIVDEKTKVDPPKPDPPPPPPPPVPTCCHQCYQGHGGGPCHYGYGTAAPPPTCYDGYSYEYQYGGDRPCYGYEYQYGGDRPCYAIRSDYYYSDDNPQGCTIM